MPRGDRKVLETTGFDSGNKGIDVCLQLPQGAP
jgi:hypothetical protein